MPPLTRLVDPPINPMGTSSAEPRGLREGDVQPDGPDQDPTGVSRSGQPVAQGHGDDRYTTQIPWE